MTICYDVSSLPLSKVYRIRTIMAVKITLCLLTTRTKCSAFRVTAKKRWTRTPPDAICEEPKTRVESKNSTIWQWHYICVRNVIAPVTAMLVLRQVLVLNHHKWSWVIPQLSCCGVRKAHVRNADSSLTMLGGPVR